MCRFVAYFGRKPVILEEILEKPSNSMINQSRRARESATGLNADGFGLGWYDQEISSTPGLFKSTQPAWNDQNLSHIASKIESNCFIGHVRASTVGDVTTINCHPFSFGDYLFAHNGTIKEFHKIKRALQSEFTDQVYDIVKGQTDSENFFALMMQEILQETDEINFKILAHAFRTAVAKVNELKLKLNVKSCSRLNIVLTDGQRMIATRYVSDPNESALSLYYAFGRGVYSERGMLMADSDSGHAQAVVIASERLSDYAQEWHEIPINHVLCVDKRLKVTLDKV